MYLILAQLTETVYSFLLEWILFLVNLISLLLCLIHLEFSLSQPLSFLSLFKNLVFLLCFLRLFSSQWDQYFCLSLPSVKITELLLILGFPTDFPFPFKLFVSIGENLILIFNQFFNTLRATNFEVMATSRVKWTERNYSCYLMRISKCLSQDITIPVPASQKAVITLFYNRVSRLPQYLITLH